MGADLHERLEALFAEAATAKGLPEKDHEYLRLRKELQDITATYGLSPREYEQYHRRLVDSLDY